MCLKKICPITFQVFWRALPFSNNVSGPFAKWTCEIYLIQIWNIHSGKSDCLSSASELHQSYFFVIKIPLLFCSMLTPSGYYANYKNISHATLISPSMDVYICRPVSSMVIIAQLSEPAAWTHTREQTELVVCWGFFYQLDATCCCFTA